MNRRDRERGMTDNLESGERGSLRDPAGLPRPALWPAPPAGAQPAPVTGRETGSDEDARSRFRAAYLAVGLMCAGLILLAVAAISQLWWVAAAGVVVGAVGAIRAIKARILQAATVADE